MNEEKQNLPAIIEKSGIETEQALLIQEQFRAFLKQVKEWGDKAFEINITSIDQKFEIAEANKAYKIVKSVRLETEARRKELKEDSLRKGKLIDSIAKFVFEKLEPIEEHLEKQAKFVKLQEEKAVQQLVSERKELLSKYVEDLSIFNLETMPQDTFDKLLEDIKVAFETKKDKEAQEEKELADKQEAERIENERIRKENEVLKKEQEAKEKELQAEKEKAIKLQREKEQQEEKERKEKEAQELKAKQELEAKEKAERDAKNAPDKEKLEIYANYILAIEAPQNLSKAAQEIIKVAQEELLKVSHKIKDSLKVL